MVVLNRCICEGITLATEKLNPSKLPKDISNIERALKGDTVALSLFTTVTGEINIPKSVADGKGLTLLRQDSGSWIWFYRYRVNGRASKMSLGTYPLTTLAMARQAHKEAYSSRTYENVHAPHNSTIKTSHSDYRTAQIDKRTP